MTMLVRQKQNHQKMEWQYKNILLENEEQFDTKCKAIKH